jgi:AcrR family transcriptional regulator
MNAQPFLRRASAASYREEIRVEFGSPMRAKRASDGRGADTVTRIITAAERLFGMFGVEGVSTRQIMLEAGASNKSAIAYHFGDRSSLVTAIWNRRLPELEAVRATMLSEVIAAGRQHDPYTLAQVLILPTYGLVDERGHHSYAVFLGQALRWGMGRTIRLEAMNLSPASRIAGNLFGEALGATNNHLFNGRMRLATGLFCDAVASRDRALASGEPAPCEDHFLAEVTAMFVACCKAQAPDQLSLLRSTS